MTIDDAMEYTGDENAVLGKLFHGIYYV